MNSSVNIYRTANRYRAIKDEFEIIMLQQDELLVNSVCIVRALPPNYEIL